MGFGTYRAVLGLRDVRRVLLLGLVVRIPLWASSVIVTLHVVTHLGRSYGAAGFLAGVATVALSISAPWRGRRLDRVGLRRAVVPSLFVLAACWSVAPFVGYWLLLALAAVAGLFVIPSFSIVRQVLLHAVPEHQRTTALSIDSVVVELSFMIGPALGVLLATYCPTSWALFACEFASIAGGVLIWVVNPPLRNDDIAADNPAADNPAADNPAADNPAADNLAADDGARRVVKPGVRGWVTLPAVAALLAAMAATLVLTGTDVGVVAALRDMDHQAWIGWELAVWGAGSAVGGIGYGLLRRPVPVPLLLALLAASTVPLALADDPATLAVLLFVAGLFCAPTITASVDTLSRTVPERVRGEALGWHGSAMTLGSAIGAPLAGVAIDRAGWQGGFVLPALVGLAVAGLGWVAFQRRSVASATAPSPSLVKS